MRRLARALRAILGRSPLLTRWSAIATLPVALTVMGPYLGPDEPDTLPRLLLAALISWAIPALLLWPVARASRELLAPGARVLLVAIPVVALAAARPLLTDLCGRLLGVEPAPAEWLPFRIATNAVVWPVLLLAIAALVSALRALRATNRRLADAIEDEAGDEERLHAREAEARAAIAGCLSDLRGRLDALDPPTGETVLAFATGPVRDWSHRFAADAAVVVVGGPVGSVPSAGAPGGRRAPRGTGGPRRSGERRTRGPKLRLPPIGVVGLAYALAVLPYALRTVPPAELAGSAALILLGGTAIELLARRTARGAAVLPAFWGGLGLVLAAVQLADPALPGAYAWVPVVALPAIAVLAARISALVHGLRADERRLETALRDRRHRLGESGAGLAHRLRDAAAVLHRDVQGACVRFAADRSTGASDAGAADGADGLRAEVLDALARIEHASVHPAPASAPAGGAERLDAALSSWGRALELSIGIDADARGELDRSARLAEAAYDTVTEGLVNAVKHSDSRTASIRISRIPTGAGPALQIEVAAPGILPPGAALRHDAPAAGLGAELLQRGGETVLRARLRPPAVVPPEHRGRPLDARA